MVGAMFLLLKCNGNLFLLRSGTERGKILEKRIPGIKIYSFYRTFAFSYRNQYNIVVGHLEREKRVADG